MNIRKSYRLPWIVSAVLAIALILLAKQHYFPSHSEVWERPPRILVDPLSDESEASSRTTWKSADFFLSTDRPLPNCNLQIWKILTPSQGKRELVLKFDHWAGWIFAEHRNTEIGSLLSFRGSHRGSVLLSKNKGDIIVLPRMMASSVDIGNIALVIISLPDGKGKVPPEVFSSIQELPTIPLDALSPLVEQFGVELFAFEFSKTLEPVAEDK